jgi:rhamnulokinase
MKKHIAVDLGASNGRVTVGDLHGCTVVHRFPTPNETVLGSLHWNLLGLFSEIKEGLRKAFAQYGDQIVSIGIDGWGVDHGLLDESGSLVSLVYHYRDGRTDDLVDAVATKLGGRRAVYERTGIAFHSFNTIYQLAAMQRDRPRTLEAACHYLSVPDLLAYWLTGVMANERSHASTTQLYDPKAGTWAWDLVDAMGFDRNLFGTIVDSGTVLGPLTDAIRHEVGCNHPVSVIASASHDTAAAVAAVPVGAGEVPLYLSSGTWSLLGVERDEPVLDALALESGFSNEVGNGGKITFHKNIMGMWIQQECVRHWSEYEGPISWKDLDEQTLEACSYEGEIDPGDELFLKPNRFDDLMTDRIDRWCEQHGMRKPSGKGEYMVAIYRGLAKTYARSVAQLQAIAGSPFSSLCIIGGGSKNEILDRWTAKETGLPVYAGPVEATALGNIVVQMLATGELESLQEGREYLKREQKIRRFDP